MAYIPPHKRISKEMERQLLTPEVLAPQFEKNLNIKSSSKINVDKSAKFIYAKEHISRLCTIGLDDKDQFPSFVKLEPISLESTEFIGEKPLALINTSLHNEGGEVIWNLPKCPWVSIAENVLDDLLSSFKNVRNEMECQTLEEVKPNLVAKVGKILFHRKSSIDLEFLRKSLAPEILKRWKRSFHTGVPVSYKENIVKEVVPKIGVEFKGEKETYHVKLSDSRRPESTFTCKCRVTKEHGNGKLQLYKIELNQLRNMVVDLSCLDKNLDLRLMLCTKRIPKDLTDDEMQIIRDLISSAVVDPDVKGGLRWPFGEASSGDQYNVVGIWHTITTTYKNRSLKLKIRQANRFNFRTSAGEVSWEISLFFKNLFLKLQEENVEVNLISGMLQENLRLMWDNFLCCESFLM